MSARRVTALALLARAGKAARKAGIMVAGAALIVPVCLALATINLVTEVDE